jgi:2-polyprenyl-3-methyl-5-hydroxy-6-metoxy-1,4-benzoquinol methylase
MINALPMGEKPRIARRTRLTNAGQRPARAKRCRQKKQATNADQNNADILPKPFDMPPEVLWIDADLDEPLAEPDESFDVILCCEDIQCLENPRAIAREFFRLLRSNGTVIISTPNNESVRAIAALWIQGHFVSFGESSYPYHKTALLRTDLDRLLGEAGFDRREFFYSNHGGLPKKPSLTWQRISGGWLAGKRFSDNIFAIARKTSTSPL